MNSKTAWAPSPKSWPWATQRCLEGSKRCEEQRAQEVECLVVVGASMHFYVFWSCQLKHAAQQKSTGFFDSLLLSGCDKFKQFKPFQPFWCSAPMSRKAFQGKSHKSQNRVQKSAELKNALIFWKKSVQKRRKRWKTKDFQPDRKKVAVHVPKTRGHWVPGIEGLKNAMNWMDCQCHLPWKRL